MLLRTEMTIFITGPDPCTPDNKYLKYYGIMYPMSSSQGIRGTQGSPKKCNVSLSTTTVVHPAVIHDVHKGHVVL